MTSSTVDLEKLAYRLEEFSTILKSGQLDKTAAWLSSTADRVKLKDLKDVETNYEGAYKAARSEFSKGNPKLEDLFNEIRARMPLIPKSSPLSIQQMEKLLEETKTPQQVFAQIIKVFNSSSLTMEQQFYGLCFQYVILVEGIYDQALRYLLLWWENSKGKCPDVRNMSIGDVKKELGAAGASPLLFEGWERRIRNSIAHVRFSYDPTRDEAIFDDVDLEDPLNSFHKEMTYNEFREMRMALYNVVFLIEINLVMGHLVPMILIAAGKVP